MNRAYELVVVISPQLNEKKFKAELTAVEAVVDKAKGKVVKKEDWGKKALSYPIKKETEGMYVLFRLELPSEQVREVDKKLRLREDMLRFLLVGVAAVVKKRGKRGQ